MSVPASAAQQVILRNDEDAAYRYALQQMNINPNVGGDFGRFLRNRFAPQLQSRVATVGLTNNPREAIDEVIRNFSQGATQRGNTGWFGQQAAASQQAVNNGVQHWNAFPDQRQAAAQMSQMSANRWAHLAPRVQAAYAQQQQDAMGDYADYDFKLRGAAQSPDTYANWLRRNNRWGVYGG